VDDVAFCIQKDVPIVPEKGKERRGGSSKSEAGLAICNTVVIGQQAGE
jgi:hypothetical protein